MMMISNTILAKGFIGRRGGHRTQGRGSATPDRSARGRVVEGRTFGSRRWRGQIKLDDLD